VACAGHCRDGKVRRAAQFAALALTLWGIVQAGLAGSQGRVILFRHGLPEGRALEESVAIPDTVELLPWIEETVIADLRRLAAQGYPLASLDSAVLGEKEGRLAVHLYYAPGPGPGSLRVELEFADSLRIPKELRSLNDAGGLNLRRVAENLRRLEERLLNSGHPYYLVCLDSLRLEGQALRLRVRLDEGPQVILASVSFPDVRQTRPSTLARYFGVRTGDPFRLRDVERGLQNLRRLPYVQGVDKWQLALDGEKRGHLRVWLKERSVNQFEGVAGYMPERSGPGGYVVGLLDLRLGNLFGTGRMLGVHWDRKDRWSQEASFSYTEPFLGPAPVGAQVEVRQRVQDSTYVLRGFGMRLVFSGSQPWQVAAELGRETVFSPRGQTAASRSRSWTLGAGLLVDQRDDPQTPRKGFVYRTGIRLLQRTYEGLSPSNDREVSMDVETYVPLAESQVTAVQLHLRSLRSAKSEIPVSELFRLGGASSLRGYWEDQFVGADVLWSNLEYRYILGERSWAFAFVDVGYVGRRPVGSPLWRTGYGMGVRLPPVSGLGQFGIELGLGTGENISEAKVHVRLITAF